MNQILPFVDPVVTSDYEQDAAAIAIISANTSHISGDILELGKTELKNVLGTQEINGLLDPIIVTKPEMLKMIDFYKGNRIIYIYSDKKNLYNSPSYAFASKLFDKEDGATLTIFLGQLNIFSVNGSSIDITNVQITFLGAGDTSIYSYVLKFFGDPKKIMWTHPGVPKICNNISSFDVQDIIPSETLYLLGNEYDAVSLFCTPAINTTTKIISILHAFVPYIRVQIMKKYKAVPKAYFEITNDITIEKLEPNDTIWGHKAKLAIAVAILYFAYIKNKNMAQKLLKRINAAAGSLGHPKLKELEISKFLKTCNLSHKNSNRIIEAIGWILAVDSNFSFNKSLESNQLASMDAIKQYPGIQHWTAAIIKQARMVYTDYNITSIKMGLNVLPLFEKFFNKTPDDWNEEIKNLKSISAKLKACPYLGMTEKLETIYTISQAPKLTYLGVLYKEHGMTENKEKENFKAFVKTSITKHIPREEDRVNIEYLAKTIPSNLISTMASLIVILPLDKAKTVAETLTPEQRVQVYDYISLVRYDKELGYADPGEWFTYMEFENKTLKQVEGDVYHILEDRKTYEYIEANKISDYGLRMAANDAIEVWYKGIVAKISKARSEALLDRDHFYELESAESFLGLRFGIITRLVEDGPFLPRIP